MSNSWKLTYYFLVLYLYLNPISANDGTTCQNDILGKDQTVIYQDYGPEGVRGPLNVTLPSSLQPGATISVVVKSKIRGSVNLISDDIYVIHIDARIQAPNFKNELIINTSKYLNLEWRPDGVQFANPVKSNTKTTETLIYEAECYRIFINGKELTCYKHRTNREPKVLAIYQDKIYKVLISTATK